MPVSDLVLGKLEEMLSQEPEEEDIMTAKGDTGNEFRFLTKSTILKYLNEDFAYDWDWILDRETFGSKNMSLSGRLIVRFHGVTIVRSGTSAVPYSKSNHVKLDYPYAEGVALISAARKLGRRYGAFLNSWVDDAIDAQVAPLKETPEELAAQDEAFEKLKKELIGIEKWQDAQMALAMSPYLHNQELKDIVSSKFKK